jgi:Uma2 family endonuclease
MATTVVPAEQRVVLHNISWETYQRLLAENIDNVGARFFYDEGVLEIMVVGVAHERPNWLLSTILEIVADRMGLDYFAARSTTFQRADLEKGFEPDSCYYFERAADVQQLDRLDLTVDPPPDIVIEVDISSSSLHKFRIFAALGVPEVWRYDGERVVFYRLQQGAYAEVADSVWLPSLTASVATSFVREGREQRVSVWKRRVRQWAEANCV